MPPTDAGVTKAREVFTEHGGMLRTSKALRLGIHPRTLYALRDAWEIEQIGEALQALHCTGPFQPGPGSNRDSDSERRGLPDLSARAPRPNYSDSAFNRYRASQSRQRSKGRWCAS